MINIKSIGISVAVAAFFTLIFAVYHYEGKFQEEKERADRSGQQAEMTTVVNKTILSSLSVINVVLGGNHNVKQEITLESERTARDVKNAVSGNDCVVLFIPSNASKRLRKFTDGLHPRSTSPPSR